MSASAIAKPGHTGRRLALLVLAGANLALMLQVAGTLSALADVFAPLTGHLVGIGLTAALALLARRYVPLILTAGGMLTMAVHVSLGLAGCCAAPVPTRPSQLAKVAHASTESLTVLALNSWHRLGDQQRLEHYLITAPADVIVLSEFGPDKRPMLARLRETYPFQVECADRWDCALALISRRSLTASGVGPLGADHQAGAAKPMADFVWAKVGGLGGSLTIIGTHVYRPSRDPWLHQRQMEALSGFLRNIEGPLVLAGDLNTSPWSNAFRQLRAATGLAPASILMPTWPAWPLPLPQVALDHILVSSDLIVAAAGTGPAVGSDHLPVWAHIDRRPAPFERAPSPPHKLASRLAAAGSHFGGELLGDFGGEHVGARHLRR
jgi:endonuclease/exonuclease/phosphatase (EEP) superfamily protein YafD